jgi:hypothetical protein
MVDAFPGGCHSYREALVAAAAAVDGVAEDSAEAVVVGLADLVVVEGSVVVVAAPTGNRQWR